MTTLTINGKDYHFPSSYDEIKSGLWYELDLLFEKRETYISPTHFTLDVATLLCGAEPEEFDNNIGTKQLVELTQALHFLNASPNTSLPDHYHINGIDYVFKLNFEDDLTAGEEALIEQYQLTEKEPKELMYKILAVLIRPATKLKDDELNKEYWKLEDLRRLDGPTKEKLEHRKNVIRDNISGIEAAQMLNFFLSFKERQKKFIESYLSTNPQPHTRLE